jgi:two-component system, LytTR family, response regulator
MNCIAIDDEPLALNVIKDFCSKISYLNLVETCSNAVDAVKVLNRCDIGLIFLDIQMPQLSGLEFIKSLSNPPMIIFTTAYSEHALMGFELNAVDYLVKPIPFERFFKAANKAYELYNHRNKNIPGLTASNGKDLFIAADYFLIKVEYSTVRVNFADILYIEGLKDYVKIVTDVKNYLTKTTMKNIEEKLPSERFIRVHKSYIISLSRISKIENNRIIFKDKYIPIGDQFKDLFNKLIDKNRL